MTAIKTCRSALLGGAVAALLCGCSMYQEGKLTPNHVQVEETRQNQEYPVSELDGNAIGAIADDFTRYGGGPMDVAIAYDPYSRSATAMKAGDEALRIKQTLTKAGVDTVHTAIVPVKGIGDGMKAVISYAGYKALPPKDCGVMAGMEDTDVDVDPDYRLGCSIETALSRQIARPADLLGRGQDQSSSDGRRAGVVVERYRTGTPNEPLEGETASE